MDSLIIFLSQYLIFVMAFAAVVITLTSAKKVRNRLIITSILAFLLAFVLAWTAGKLYVNPRPFVVEGIQPLFPHAPDNGFPSDHTLVAMTIASVIFIYRRTSGLLLGVCGVLVGTARVLAGVHHAVDILGGIGIAVVASTLAWLIFSRVSPRFQKYF